MTSVNPFSAAGSALGYLYQVRIGLLWALRRWKTGDEFQISLETLDDVTFEAQGAPSDLLQTKHHLNSLASLTDASPDLWKSLRVWFESSASGLVPKGTSLHLLTTAAAPAGSVASFLQDDGTRNVDKAVAALAATASSSQSESNAAAYAAFLKADESTRKNLVGRIVVHDASESVTDLDGTLRQEVFAAADRNHLDAFLERLEGWWFRRCLRQLNSTNLSDRISVGEIEAQMAELRNGFKQDSLVIDPEVADFELDELTFSTYSGRTFVRQLEIVNQTRRSVFFAVRDYLKAFEQRSRWLRSDLLHIGDLRSYERRLSEEWEFQFYALVDALGEGPAEEAMQQAAQDVLRWAQTADIPIRPAVAERFVARGSLHMLADDLRVGWHPQYKERLAVATPEGETT